MQSLIKVCFTVLVVLACVPKACARDLEEGASSVSGLGGGRPDGSFPGLSDLERAAGSFRGFLARRGFTFSLCLRADGFLNTRGGLNTHDAQRFRWDVSFYGDLETGRAGWYAGGGVQWRGMFSGRPGGRDDRDALVLGVRLEAVF